MFNFDVTFTVNILLNPFFFRHKSYLTLGVYDSNESLAGVMFLGVHPNIPALSPGDWEPWLYEMYAFYQVNSYNSLWIKLLIWNPIYYLLFLKPMVQYLFKSTLELKFLLTIVPPGNFEADFLDNMGYPMKPKGKIRTNFTQ